VAAGKLGVGKLGTGKLGTGKLGTGKLSTGKQDAFKRRVARASASDRAAWPPRWRLVNAALAVLLVVVAVGASVAVSRWQDQRRLEGDRQAALAAAKQAAVNFVSVSQSTVDADMQRIIDSATGDFKDQYVSNKATFHDQIVANKASATGTVLRAAILSSDSDSAVVLVAVDATIKNAGTPDGRLSHYRLQLNMARDGGTGRWLVAQLDFVG
jgi:Mce-associated membrane protein